MATTMRVYIIHSRQDSALSHLVCGALARSGYSVWIDWPSTHRSFQDELRHYMRMSQLIVAIWTPSAGNSPGIRLEWNIARALGKRIILVSVGGCRPDDIPQFCDIVDAPTAEDVANSLISFLDANRGHSIFISYATEDAEQAKQVLTLINCSRHHVWLDRFSLDPGMDFPSEILRAIDDCNFLFLIWSCHAQLSSWVEREWNYAYEQSREIIPVLLDDTPLPRLIAQVNGFRGVGDDGIRSFLGIVKEPVP